MAQQADHQTHNGHQLQTRSKHKDETSQAYGVISSHSTEPLLLMVD
jgi:hypothetical protein